MARALTRGVWRTPCSTALCQLAMGDCLVGCNATGTGCRKVSVRLLSPLCCCCEEQRAYSPAWTKRAAFDGRVRRASMINMTVSRVGRMSALLREESDARTSGKVSSSVHFGQNNPRENHALVHQGIALPPIGITTIIMCMLLHRVGPYLCQPSRCPAWP